MSRPAVILDRDGTLIHEARYLDRLERLQFFPYTIDAVRLLNRAGFEVQASGSGYVVVQEPGAGSAATTGAARTPSRASAGPSSPSERRPP